MRLLVSAAVKAEPTVSWVKLSDPTKAGYNSWVPCIRTSGVLLPQVQCMPTESRSELLTLHGTDPHVDCRLPDRGPGADCRVPLGRIR